MHTTVLAVPVDGARDVAGAQVVEGMALGRVTLSQVVRERPDVAGVAGDEGFERAAGADRAELAVIADGDQFRPRGLHGRQQPCQRRRPKSSSLRPGPGHGAGVSTSWPCSMRQVSDATVREATPAPSPRALAAWPEVAAPMHLVTGGLEAFPHRRKGARLARAGNPDHQVQGMAGSEQALGDFGLSLGETEAPGKLHVPDGRSCRSRRPRGPGPLGQESASSAIRRSSSTTQAAAQTGSLARETSGRAIACSCVSTLSTALSKNETGRPCRWGRQRR